jgi:S-adenosylmethionine/arginine decarboxylase-like enzyme
MSWGQHLILDCSNCNLEAITDKATINNFVVTLIERIGMTAFGSPQIELMLVGTSNEGYSLLQMITTSNITAHFVNSTRDAYIDIFSCKEFNTSIAMNTVDEFFAPASIKSQILFRQA